MSIYFVKILNLNIFFGFYLVLMKYFLLVFSMGIFYEVIIGNFRIFFQVKQNEDFDGEICYMKFFFQICISKVYRIVLIRYLV